MDVVIDSDVEETDMSEVTDDILLDVVDSISVLDNFAGIILSFCFSLINATSAFFIKGFGSLGFDSSNFFSISI